jgi:hypothetical protein
MASSGLSDPPTSPGGPFELCQPPANTSAGTSAAAEVEEEAQEEDISDEDEEDDEEMGDADEEEGYDDEPVYPEDIVPETRKLWKKLRDAAAKRYHRGHRSTKRQRQSLHDKAPNYTIRTFLQQFIANTSNARDRADIRNVLLSDEVMDVLGTIGVVVKSVGDELEDGEYSSLSIRKEMKSLLSQDPFKDFSPARYRPEAEESQTTVDQVCDTTWLETTLQSAWPTLQTKAPSLTALVSQLMASQYSSKKDMLSLKADDRYQGRTYIVVSVLLSGYAANTSTFLRDVLGLYMLANGTPRRIIETFQKLGVCRSYSSLNKQLTEMAQQAEKDIIRAAHDPNAVVVYDNFNYLDKVQDLSGGKQAIQRNLTTALLVQCPDLGGKILQSDVDLTQPFTRKMAEEYLVPRKKSIDYAARHLLTDLLYKIFAPKDAPEFPSIEKVSFTVTPYLQLGSIEEDEGTIEGVYRLHEELFNVRLKYKDTGERLMLVCGDSKTGIFIRKIQASQLEASNPWERRQWILAVPAFFHVELNYVEFLFRVFWSPEESKVRTTASLYHDANYLGRQRAINKKSVKYHQAMPLLKHGFAARILTLFLYELKTQEPHLFPHNVLNMDDVERVMKGFLTEENRSTVAKLLDAVYKKVFSVQGWTGKYDGVADEQIDVEFRNHCRLMQCVEVLLSIHEAIRRGDFGYLRDIIPQLPVLFWGGKSSNYGPDMLYLAWILHPVVTPDARVRDAILKSGLVSCSTAGSGYKPIDLALEHVNGAYALDIKHNKNSTHDVQKTFSRLALNGNYLSTIRRCVEGLCKSRQKGTRGKANATNDVLSMACKLFNDGMPLLKASPPGTWSAPDVYSDGSRTLLSKLTDFNEGTVRPKDVTEQEAEPGTGFLEDIRLNGDEEGERMFGLGEGDDSIWEGGLGWVDGVGDDNDDAADE